MYSVAADFAGSATKCGFGCKTVDEVHKKKLKKTWHRLHDLMDQ